MHQPLTKIAFIEAKTSDTNLLKRELLTLCEHTCLEPGCLQFTFFYLDKNNEHILLFEQFHDQGALDAHMQANHTQHFFQQKLISVGKLYNLEELTNA